MARFYSMSVQPDLFREWSLVREWDRLGRGEQVRAVPCPTPAEAHAALETIRAAKVRKGYVAPSSNALFKTQAV